jgi:hypothetical protein
LVLAKGLVKGFANEFSASRGIATKYFDFMLRSTLHKTYGFARSSRGRFARFSPPCPSGLFWLLQPLTLAESHAGAAAVLVDEFERPLQRKTRFFGNPNFVSQKTQP